GTLCAGDRAPEAPGLVIGGQDTSLFRLFTPSHHTVLIFAEFAEGDIRKALDSSAKYPDAIVDGHARHAYLVKGGSVTIVIVRLDGFIGAIVNDVDGIARYFSKIFQIPVS
ncbi:hypothetical protein PILCRDRAFT_55100, partial [Piloderma croceum F 1598]